MIEKTPTGNSANTRSQKVNVFPTLIDRTARGQLATLVQRILRDELTGWQIHDLADPIPCDDDAVSSVIHLIGCMYAGWERTITPLDPETRFVLERCVAFLTTDSSIKTSSDKFMTIRRFWFNKFDLDGFMRQVQDGIWPFSSEEERREAHPGP